MAGSTVHVGRGRRYGRPVGARVNRLVLAVLWLLAATASAQGGEAGGGEDQDGQAPPPRLVAVHHQALPPVGGEGPFRAEVALPPPRLGAWEAVTAEADVACLVPLGVRQDADAGRLVLDLDVRGAAGPEPAAGEACGGTVVLRFRGEGGGAAVALGVHFHRPHAPPHQGHGLVARYAIDRIGRGERAPANYPPAHYMELSVANEGGSAVRVLRLLGLEELRRLRFEALPVPSDGPPGSLDGLEPLSGDLDVVLAPGDSFRLAVVVDPAAELPQDAGAAAVQPALLVEVGGELRTVRFDLFTTVWGVAGP